MSGLSTRLVEILKEQPNWISLATQRGSKIPRIIESNYFGYHAPDSLSIIQLCDAWNNGFSLLLRPEDDSEFYAVAHSGNRNSMFFNSLPIVRESNSLQTPIGADIHELKIEGIIAYGHSLFLLNSPKPNHSMPEASNPAPRRPI